MWSDGHDNSGARLPDQKKSCSARFDRSFEEKLAYGLHHNWHDWNFKYDPLFDFSMAGDGDLIEVDSKYVPRIPMDACNFVEEDFYPGTAEKFWDILFVARAVFFKRIPEFFKTVRELYDRGHMYRVLFICPVPPYDPNEEKQSSTRFVMLQSDVFETERSLLPS